MFEKYINEMPIWNLMYTFLNKISIQNVFTLKKMLRLNR